MNEKNPPVAPMGPVRALRLALISCTDVGPGAAGAKARAVLLQLRAMGCAVVPMRATRAMTNAASAAMRQTGFLAGSSHQAAHQKHALRYAAMIEVVQKDFA